jgi:hypothetical protein
MAGCVTKRVCWQASAITEALFLSRCRGHGEFAGFHGVQSLIGRHACQSTPYRNSVKYALESLDAANTKAYQSRLDILPDGLGTTFGVIGDQAVACLQLLPKLMPDKDYGEKLCRKAFV